MNREEHIVWAKERALAELDADPCGQGPTLAISSMISDLGKHPDTAGHTGIELTGLLAFGGHLARANDVREHIEGFQ